MRSDAFVRSALTALTALTCLAAASSATVLSGCESGYQISMEVSDGVNAGCDVSCVHSVWVEAYGDSDYKDQCLRDVSMKSLRDHGLGGQFDLPVPEELRGIWITGWRGSNCDDLVTFDGITAVQGADVKVPMRCVATCGKPNQIMLQLRTISVMGVAQGTCEAGTVTTQVTEAAAGSLRATHFDQIFPGATYATEFNGSVPVPVATGRAVLPGLVSTGTPQSCAAVMLFSAGRPVSTSCTSLSSKVCSDAQTTEVAMDDAVAALMLGDGYRTVAVFARPNGDAPIPVADAVATVAPGGPPATIRYLKIEPGAVPRFVETTNTKTDASGAFMVISREPVTVTVTAPGVSSTRVVSGGSLSTVSGDFIVGGAQIFTPD